MTRIDDGGVNKLRNVFNLLMILFMFRVCDILTEIYSLMFELLD